MQSSQEPSSNAIKIFLGNVVLASSPDAVNYFLSTLPRPPQYAAIRQYVIYHEKDLSETILQKVPKNQRNITVTQVNSDTPVFELRKSGKDDHPAIEGVVAVVPGTHPFFHRIVTVSYSDFWNRVVSEVVGSLYPQAMPVYFTQNEIWQSLSALEKQIGTNYQVRAVEATMKGNRSTRTNAVINRFNTDTERIWGNLSIDDVFKEALERDEWFTSIKFKISSKNKRPGHTLPSAVGRIYKHGNVSYTLLHDSINTSLMRSLEVSSSNRLQKLQNRGIRERNYEPGAPLQILYDTDVFNEVEEVRRFGKLIGKYPNSTLAVFHSNPYYHAHLADFLDGSSFELWVLSARRILIVPKAKASAQALERLISYIYYQFKEGNVDEYRE